MVLDHLARFSSFGRIDYVLEPPVIRLEGYICRGLNAIYFQRKMGV